MNMIDDQTTLHTTSQNDLFTDEFSSENKFKFKDIKKNPNKVNLRRRVEEELHAQYYHKNDELADLGWH